MLFCVLCMRLCGQFLLMSPTHEHRANEKHIGFTRPSRTHSHTHIDASQFRLAGQFPSPSHPTSCSCTKLQSPFSPVSAIAPYVSKSPRAFKFATVNLAPILIQTETVRLHGNCFSMHDAPISHARMGNNLIQVLDRSSKAA